MKVFLGIELSDKFTQEVTNWQKKNSKLPVQFTKPQNLHITLIPPWYADGELELIKRLRKINKSSFGITFDEIAINMVTKVVWTEPSKAPYEINQLQAISIDAVGRLPETRAFVPHVTVAQFSDDKLMEEVMVSRFSWREQINNITLFQSIQMPTGIYYNKLFSMRLRD